MKTGDEAPKPTILVAPLDWGLGHATRCVPIIRMLMNNNCTVYLAGEGPIKQLLQREFPFLPFLDLRGYRIHYGAKGWHLALQIVRQIPAILNVIASEKRWLYQQLNALEIDGVISDNRFGLGSSAVPTSFITHQLNIKSGLGCIIDRLLQKLNYRYINSFGECWVPDLEGQNNLAGRLSHPHKTPGVPLKYAGVLSRFNWNPVAVKAKHVLCIISGPEPQRSLFEDIMLSQISFVNCQVVIVRGKPDSDKLVKKANGFEIYDHLPARQLEEKITQASFVVSRSGYSSIMDLLSMKKKCIFIPTPGQPEQEYLARHLLKHSLAFCIEEKNFGLKDALQQAGEFPYRLIEDCDNNKLRNLLDSFVSKCLRTRETRHQH